MKKIIFLGLIAVLMAMVTGNSFAGGPTPSWKETEISRQVLLPQKIEVVPPAKDLPQQTAAFSYRWEGVWGDISLPVVLIVEKIDSATANVIYCCGRSTYTNKPDYYCYKAKVIPGEKTKIEFISVGRSSIKFTFEMGEDLKTLYGEYQSSYSQAKYNVVMKKIED